jgi:hypothetical protein
MKKLFYILATALVFAVACSKEAVVNNDENTNVPSGRYTLYAELPQFIDAATKASVNDLGVFSWTAGDEINVVFYSTANAGYIYRVFTCTDASAGKFEIKDGEAAIPDGYNLNSAMYPVSFGGVNASNQTFTSLDAAAKGFQMTATVSEGKLVFAHKNALLKVTVNNVPSFAKKLTVGNVEIALSLSAAGRVDAYVPMAPAAAAKMSIAVTDGSNNTIISKTSQNQVALVAANLYTLPTLTIGPVLDALQYATSWTKINTYIVGVDGDYKADLSSETEKMAKYNDGTNNHYYRVLPASALNNTYRIVYYNTANDDYRVVTSISVANQNAVSVSQKEGVRTIGDSHHRLIIRDEQLGTALDTNPDTYLYIKGVKDVSGSDGLTGSWLSDATKALGWFTSKRNSSLSGRYYYFDTNALSSYTGKEFWFSYLMYAEGTNNNWRYADNYKSPVNYANYIHLGFYYDNSDLKVYNDSAFDSQVSE